MQNKSNKFLFFLLAILFAQFTTQVKAQTPYFKSYVFDKEQTDANVICVFQDYRKIIWLGTDIGLYSYDGYDFKRVFIADSVLGKGTITAIAQDHLNRLWIGTNTGKVFYNENGIWKKTQFNSITAKINAIVEDANHMFWIGTYGDGIFTLLNNQQNKINTQNGLSDDNVYCLAKDKTGKIWAGTDYGISVCSLNNNKLSIKKINDKNGLPDNIIKAIVPDEIGDMWLGTDDKGVCKYIVSENTIEMPEKVSNWNYGAVNHMLLLDNELWIGTSTQGIIDFEYKGENRLRQFNNTNGYPAKSASFLFKDAESNIWIASGNNIIKSPGELLEFKTLSTDFAVNNIFAICNGSNGKLYISTNQGLFYSEAGNVGIFHEISNSLINKNTTIVSLYEDQYGFLWIGTFNKGLFRYNPANGKTIHIPLGDVNSASNVLAITGNNDVIWLAALEGAFRVSLLQNLNTDNPELFTEKYDQKAGLGNNYMFQVFIDSKNRVWFATDGKGVTVFSHERFINYCDTLGLADRKIYSIAEDRNHNIWLNTYGNGLYYFDGKTFKNFSIPDGLRDNKPTSLIANGDGNIIAFSHQGIDLINADTKQVTYFGEQSGIPYNENAEAELNAAFRDKRGNVWIGYQNTIIRFNKLRQAEQTSPLVFIDKLESSFEKINLVPNLKLSASQNNLSFRYTAVWFTNTESIHYRYRLNGFSNAWFTTKERVATFPKLPYGKFEFIVQAANNNLFDNCSEARFQFEIIQPWYTTRWFYISAVLLLSAIIYTIYTIRIKQVSKIEKLKNEKTNFEFQTLKSQVNPHFLFNSFNTLISIIENDKTVAVEYVEKLSEFFRNMVTYRQNDLISLKEELELTKVYYFLQQKRFNTSFQVIINIDDEIRNSYSIAPLTLQILVENSIKHNAISKETPLRILIFVDNDLLIIKNNKNKKLINEPSTGFGLQNITARYKLLTGKTVSIINNEKEFCVKIPLIKTAL